MTLFMGFTGHRNCQTDDQELVRLWHEYPANALNGVVWVYGAAKSGFDAQVKNFAKRNYIPLIAITPPYELFPDNPKRAPLLRDDWIVDISNIIVSCYDGRTYGGTFHTVKYAQKQGKQVIRVKAINIACL